jgi:CBS domain-containing protein
MQVRSLVAGSAVSCRPSISLRESARAMKAADVGSIAVMDGRNLVGIFTERDLLNAMAAWADPDRDSVQDWMTEDPDTVEPDLEAEEAADWMMATGHRHLPVTEKGSELIGIVSIKDVLWALTESDTRRRVGAKTFNL